MINDHLERLEALLKRSPGILWEGLTASEVGDVRACLDELKQTRAQLAAIGETEAEWAVRWRTAGGRYNYELCDDEQEAREAVSDDDDTCEVVKRVVGDWQVSA